MRQTWTVIRSDLSEEQVVADRAVVSGGGSLNFHALEDRTHRNSHYVLLLAYAPGQWLTVALTAATHPPTPIHQ